MIEIDLGSYPVEDFLADYDEIQPKLEEFEDDYDSSMAAMFVVANYMKAKHDCPVSTRRAHAFLSIMQLVSQHIHALDREDFAVHGSDRVGALVGDHVLRAAHHLYMDRGMVEGEKVTAEEIMELAATMRD